jgi:hypothetical protein
MEEITIKSGPKCPSCGIEGIEYISSVDSAEHSKSGDPWFNIAFCNQCGHIHGIFNKISLAPTVKMDLSKI